MFVKVQLVREIPEFGFGHRQVEYVGCSEKLVLLKKGKHRKVISKLLFEIIYDDAIPLTELYSIITGTLRARSVIRKKQDPKTKQRNSIRKLIKESAPNGIVSVDIVDGVINNLKGKNTK